MEESFRALVVGSN